MAHARFGGASAIRSTIILTVVAASSLRAGAHEDYNGCQPCHGDFRSSAYVSLVDGTNWGNLHNLHRYTMLNSDCNTCHLGSYALVTTALSAGGTGFQPIGCVGCHGREQDMGHDAISPGRGAGLRQHHTNAGVADCAECHTDAVPANYLPVGENVAPAYYFLPDAAHPNKPYDPCNLTGGEHYAGLSKGLDNDGDQLFDADDPDCGASCPNDLDGSGDVGFADVLQVLSAWGNVGVPEDLDGSGIVDFGDVLAVLSNWGPC